MFDLFSLSIFCSSVFCYYLPISHFNAINYITKKVEKKEYLSVFLIPKIFENSEPENKLIRIILHSKSIKISGSSCFVDRYLRVDNSL